MAWERGIVKHVESIYNSKNRRCPCRWFNLLVEPQISGPNQTPRPTYDVQNFLSCPRLQQHLMLTLICAISLTNIMKFLSLLYEAMTLLADCLRKAKNRRTHPSHITHFPLIEDEMAFVLTVKLYHLHKLVSNCSGFYAYTPFPDGVTGFNGRSKWRKEWCCSV
jgi:hypothetical protein